MQNPGHNQNKMIMHSTYKEKYELPKFRCELEPNTYHYLAKRYSQIISQKKKTLTIFTPTYNGMYPIIRF